MPLYNLYKRVLRHIDLMDRMMGVVGVRAGIRQLPDAADQLRNAANRCLTCRSADACAHFLEVNPTAEHAPVYCRNRDLFERLKIAAEDRPKAA